jgi:hypothetical protein
MASEEREHLQALLETYRRRLRILEQQEALHGVHVPPSIMMDIEDSRLKIEEIEARLNAELIPQPAQTNLVEIYQQAADAQKNLKTAHQLAPALNAWVRDFCRQLDFVVVPNSFYVYHDKFVALRIKAPTLHLNLPIEFPVILILEGELSNKLIERLPDMLDMIGGSTDFGLILTIGSNTRTQQLINKLIRPAMKTDLIVLGRGFLEQLSFSTNPQAELLREILREVDLTRVSPFMAGGADLMDRMFFGREGELKNIAEGITKTSIAITCGRRIGKTSLLNRLARIVLPARGHTCFFLNCQPVHDYHELHAEMATIWKRPDLPFDPAQPNSFAQVAAALSGSTGEAPIFLLDEVDELLKFDRQHQQRLFKQLRALSLDGRARFVMTGERSVQAYLHDANSPLFNFFGLNVRLSFLDYASVGKLVVEPLNEMQIDLRDPTTMLDTIFNATSGHPYLVQRLCQGLVQTISKKRKRVIEPEYIEVVLNDSAYQQDYFETVWGQAPLLARIITMLVGEKGASMAAISERLRRYGLAPSLREISAALDILDLYSVLVNRGGTYQFVATAFPEMMRRAYGDDIETNIELRCEEYVWEQQSSNILAH